MKVKILKAQKGDSILISFKENEFFRNILIDSGTTDTYYKKSSNTYGELKDEIELIRDKQEVIDLFILTHIDNDHICGLVECFEKDPEAYKLIKNVWFNSGKLIAKYFRQPENKDLQVPLKVFQNSQTGVKEAIEFEDFIKEKGIWDERIIIQGVSINDENISIQVLSPQESQLKGLLKEYKRVTGDTNYTAGAVKDWHLNIKDIIAEEKKPGFIFNQDSSYTNASSISFILTIKSKKFLFLADSPPKEIVKQLKVLGYSNSNPLEVEFIKVSHHGSKSNTTKELLEIIKTQNYIISTDSSGHYHPSKRTLARILDVNPDAVFHFNYEHVRNEVFTIRDRTDYKIRSRVTNELSFEE